MPASHLDRLNQLDRNELEARLRDFAQNWNGQLMANQADQLSPDHPLHLPILIEMAKIDLERRWQGGRKALLDSYLKRFPALGTSDTVTVDLILAEFRVRRQFGEAVDAAEYARRFPRQYGELKALIEQLEAKATAPASQACTPTLSSSLATLPPAPAESAAELPEQFGRYRILKKLGQGGMGAVYLAQDSQLGRQVALKVPRLAADDPQIHERFVREAHAAAAFAHPNICPLHDVGEINGILFVTMAYIEGKPLSELIPKEKGLPPGITTTIVRKVAQAMQEAHGKGIIHRDLKPANIMIDKRKEPIIMDFGLARRINAGDTRLTKSGAILGTPAYMSPEQIQGDPQGVGPGSDIYSLGVILYEMLTGQVPFRGSVAAVLGQVMTQEPEPPSKHRPDLDPSLEAICLRAMAKKIEDRYPTMKAFADTLAKFLKGEAVPAAPKAKAQPRQAARTIDQTERAPAEAPARSGGGLKTFAAAIVILGLLLGAGYLAQQGGLFQVKVENNVAVQLEGLPGQGDPLVIFLLDGRQVSREELAQPIRISTGEHELLVKRGDEVVETRKFKVGPGDKDKTIDLARKVEQAKGEKAEVDGARAGGNGQNKEAGTSVGIQKEEQVVKGDGLRRKPKEPVLLQGHTRKVRFIAFTPDGKHLISGAEDKMVIIWNVSTGKELGTINLPEHFWSIKLSPDGKTLATGLQPENLVTLWDIGSRNKRASVERDDWHRYASFLDFSPDNRLLAIGFSFRTGIWDVTSETPIATFRPGGPVVFSPDGKKLAIGSGGEVATVVDVATRKGKEFKGHAGAVYSVAFSPDSRTLATASSDKTVKLWNVASAEVLANLRGFTRAPQAVGFSRDGNTLVTWSDDSNFSNKGPLKLWDLERRQALPELAQLKTVQCWTFGTDSKTLAASTQEERQTTWTIKLVDSGIGEVYARYEEPKARPFAIDLSADLRYLAWGNDDGTVRLWDHHSMRLQRPAR